MALTSALIDAPAGGRSTEKMNAMRNFGLSLWCSAALSLAVYSPAVGQTFADLVGPTAPGVDWLVYATHAPGDTSRLFIADVWGGRIGIVDLHTRTKLPEPFLTITEPISLGGEQGLLGLAFDPDYATNGYFYVNYTGADNSLNVRRYRVLGDPATSNVADPSSGHAILNVPRTAVWHNGGWIDFSPNDGYLYMSIGDPHNVNSQDITNNLEGKILRIDPRGDDFPEDPLRNYAIPPSNPFVGHEGDDEIWAYGLRNPWRASFDRLTGDLWINDVGGTKREEVNFQPASSAGGENYAWPRREGTIDGIFPGNTDRLPGDVEPVYDYPQIGPDPLYVGNAISGSGLYRGSVDAFYGHYFFSDHGSRNIWKLDPEAIDVPASVINVNHLLLPNAGYIGRIASFGEDDNGELYLVGFDGGGVHRIATTSMDAVWNGDDVTQGNAGDGTSWENALNWTRGGSADSPFMAADNLIFAAGSSQQQVSLGSDRTVAAVTFQAPYALDDHTLRVLSGNVWVEDGVTATISSTLAAETADHSIRKLGPGTLMIQGDAGQTVVKDGTLAGSGTLDHLTVRRGGTVAPGDSLGMLTVDNSFTLEAGATLQIELAGIDNSEPLVPQYDQLVVGGDAHVAGTLEVLLAGFGSGDFEPVNGDVFTLLSAGGTLSGSFASVNLPMLSAGLAWEMESADGRSLVLRVAALLEGDYNADGFVDAADYVVWRDMIDQTGRGLAADGTGAQGVPDGIVDDLDYQLWRANFGSSLPTTEGQTAAAVPEPHASWLSTIAALLLFTWRGIAPIWNRAD